MTAASEGSAREAGGLEIAGKRVWVAGHRGMVGQALCRRLAREGCTLLTATRTEADLTRREDVDRFLARARPDLVFVAAARVGGILANATRPADFLFENLAIALNVMDGAHRSGVEKLLFLGSSCIYPKHTAQPICEEALLTGPLEPTNEAYALAKIAGLKLAEAYARQHGRRFVSAMPTNLYGPGDNYDLETSHVMPALIRKIHEAREAGRDCVEVWGTGAPRREFLHVDDLADACVFLMRRYEDAGRPINVGWGQDIAIRDLAHLIAGIVGFRGRLVFDGTKPDGAPRKLLDTGRLAAMGWRPAIPLREGIEDAYRAWRAGGETPRRAVA